MPSSAWSREDVEAILGKEAEHVDQDERYEFERCAHATWFGIDGAAIRVWFNGDGKVNRFEFPQAHNKRRL